MIGSKESCCFPFLGELKRENVNYHQVYLVAQRAEKQLTFYMMNPSDSPIYITK